MCVYVKVRSERSASYTHNNGAICLSRNPLPMRRQPLILRSIETEALNIKDLVQLHPSNRRLWKVYGRAGTIMSITFFMCPI